MNKKITRERTIVERPARQERRVRERVYKERGLTDRQIALRKYTSVIWWFTGLLEGLIGLRVALRMLAANPGTPFVNFVYRFTDVFLWPFRGLAASPSEQGFVLEVSSVIAMVVYLVTAWLFVELLWIIFERETE
ncbi:MAG: YggT family protein [Anaerolineales bacterium]